MQKTTKKRKYRYHYTEIHQNKIDFVFHDSDSIYINILSPTFELIKGAEGAVYSGLHDFTSRMILTSN